MIGVSQNKMRVVLVQLKVEKRASNSINRGNEGRNDMKRRSKEIKAIRRQTVYNECKTRSNDVFLDGDVAR